MSILGGLVQIMFFPLFFIINFGVPIFIFYILMKFAMRVTKSQTDLGKNFKQKVENFKKMSDYHSNDKYTEYKIEDVAEKDLFDKNIDENLDKNLDDFYKDSNPIKFK